MDRGWHVKKTEFLCPRIGESEMRPASEEEVPKERNYRNST